MASTQSELPNRRTVSHATMRSGIVNQANLIRGVMTQVAPQVRALGERFGPARIRHVFTTGCGDSYYAALATRLAFDRYAGVRTEAIEALEFSRYTVDYLPPGSLVVAISAGGETSRPVEAAIQARKAGALTVALTGHRGSSLARSSDAAIIQNEVEFRAPAPAGAGSFAIGNYLASMAALYLMAIELGGANGRIDGPEYDRLLAEIGRASDIIRATIAADEQAIQDLAQSVREAPAYYILGGGPSYATAMFMGAKLFEMPQALGVPVELEEWAHEQFFLTRPGTVTLVVAPPGRSIDRVREQMVGAKEVGGRIIAICDQHDAETRALADAVFPIMGELPEEFSPLTYCVPGELFAIHLCQALGKAAFAFISPRQYEVNMRQIKQSRLREQRNGDSS